MNPDTRVNTAIAQGMVGPSRRGRWGTLGSPTRSRSRRRRCIMRAWSGLSEFAADPEDVMRSRPFSCSASGRPRRRTKAARPRSSPNRKERLSLSVHLWTSWETKDFGLRSVTRSHLRLRCRCALRNDQPARGGEAGGDAERSTVSAARCRRTLLLVNSSTRSDSSVSL